MFIFVRFEQYMLLTTKLTGQLVYLEAAVVD